MKYMRSIFASAIVAVSVLSYGIANAQGPSISVDVDHPSHSISPTFFGLMTEEINHSYDGGLYAELIQNRAFEDSSTSPVHWSPVAATPGDSTISLDTTKPIAGTTLRTSLKVVVKKASYESLSGASNDGYWGIPFNPGETYSSSFFAMTNQPNTGYIAAFIVSNKTGAVLAASKAIILTSTWQRYHLTLLPKAGVNLASSDNHFEIVASVPTTFWLNEVSLFPPTFYNRANGNRTDLMGLLAGLHPSFLRMPGGNYLEGNTLADYFPWKNTLGDIDQRPGHNGPWGYRSSDGMGLLEFLDWCEDLKMQPVLAVYAGYALNGTHVETGKPLAPFVQSALDEIEYVSGPVTSKWGKVRAEDGHPEPLPLTYVEIGNEDMYDRSGSYDARFAQFYDAIKAKYPKLQLIATTHVTSRIPDVIDDHYYRSAAGNALDATHYDTADRKGPKVFVGEWASTEGNPTPTLHAALGDAAWLTGLERNSDIVVMESYAPLLVRLEKGASQWGTNLIGYDALSSYGSPSYYVQSMFASSTGARELPVTVTQPPAPTVLSGPEIGKIGLGTWNTQAEYADVSVLNGTTTLYSSDFSNGDKEWNVIGGNWNTSTTSLSQTSDESPSYIDVGDPTWSDYTLHLRARKISGAEGFLIKFRVKSNNDFIQWNIGGWGNTRQTIQRYYEGGENHEIATSTPLHVEVGRWYDIKVVVIGVHIYCYLDGILKNQTTDRPMPTPVPLYSAASLTADGSKVYVKVVNFGDDPLGVPIMLGTSNVIGKRARSWVLTGDPSGQNSISSPTRISPMYAPLQVDGHVLDHIFPAHSVTTITFERKVGVGAK